MKMKQEFLDLLREEKHIILEQIKFCKDDFAAKCLQEGMLMMISILRTRVDEYEV